MKNLSKVSIIVPTYNSERTLEECLFSIAKQSYKNIELIVVDNHSKDRTRDIARKYTSHVYTKGHERNSQRNYALQKTTGEYVLSIDSDMKLSSTVVSECVEEMMRDPSLVGLYIPEESFGEGFWAQCIKLERSYYIGKSWIEAARFFKKDILLKAGGFDEELVSGEDWYLSQQVGKLGQLGRIEALIYHNEGKPSLWNILSKKYYYATKIGAFINKSDNQHEAMNQGSNIIRRYILFFSNPVKLLRNPFVWFGMLCMKTLEYAFGFIGFLKKNYNSM